MSTAKTTAKTTTDATETADSGKRKKALVLLVILAVTGAAGWFYMKPAGAEEAPVPGEVLKLEPIQLNLAAGRYLRIGIAIQGVESGEEELEGSKALDATIELFSGRRMEDLAEPKQRDALKLALREELKERYHGEVIDVYFTDFVTQ